MSDTKSGSKARKPYVPPAEKFADLARKQSFASLAGMEPTRAVDGGSLPLPSLAEVEGLATHGRAAAVGAADVTPSVTPSPSDAAASHRNAREHGVKSKLAAVSGAQPLLPSSIGRTGALAWPDATSSPDRPRLAPAQLQAAAAAAAAAASERSGLQQQLPAAKQEAAELGQQLTEAGQTQRERNALQQALAQVQRRAEGLQQQVEEAQQRAAAAESARDDLQRAREAKESEVAALLQ
ncbi:MAG: hypothetical protein ACK4YT_13705, partial [Sphingomonas sp.]